MSIYNKYEKTVSINKDNRIVIPTAMRELLGIAPGSNNKVRLSIHPGESSTPCIIITKDECKSEKLVK